MPASYQIDSTKGIVFSQARDTFTYEDALAHVNSLRSNPDFNPSYTQLIDLRQVTAVRMTPQNVRELARQVVFLPTSKRAFVVRTKAQDQLGRLFISTLSGDAMRRVVVFDDIKAALKWLGVTKAPRMRVAKPCAH